MRIVCFCLIAAAGAGAERCADAVTPIGREIVQEMNLLRQDPPGYAMKLAELLPLYRGKQRRLGPREYLQTEEGPAAVEEALAVLRRTPPRQHVAFEPCLARSALDHVEDTGPRGLFGHDGSQGGKLKGRITRYLPKYRMIGENIDYGSPSARDVVFSLIVDDGVPDRGHRHNMLEPDFNAAGAACGPHRQMRQMCVIDFMRR